MADDISAVVSNIIPTADFFSQIWTGFLIVLALTLFGGIMFFVFTQLRYKHVFIIRKVTNGNRSMVKMTKGREMRDEDGVMWWEIQSNFEKKKQKVPVPPDGALDIDSRGKFVVEAYLNQHGEYKYIEDTINEKGIKGFKPFTSSQRVLLVNQYKKAQARKKPGLMEYLNVVAPAGMIILIMIITFAFWGEIMGPLDRLGDKLVAAADKFEKSAEATKQVNDDVQILKSRMDKIAPTP